MLSVSAHEESKLINSAKLHNRDEQTADDGAKTGMEKTTESTSTSSPIGSAPGPIEKGKEKKGNLIQFIKEVIIEFRKISWPGGKEVIQATWSVLALVAIITLLVLGFDWLLANAFFGPLEHFARLHGGGVGLNH